MTWGEKSFRFSATTLMHRGRAGTPLDEHVRGHVVPHAAQARHEAVRTHGGEMVDRHGAGKRRVVVDVDVPTEEHSVGQNDIVPEAAIVGHVGASHQEVVVAQRGDSVFLFGAAIDGDALADDVVVADHHLGVAARITDVLGLPADDRARIEVVVLADRDVSHHGHAIFQPRPAPDPHIGADDTERADFHFIVDLCPRIDAHVLGDIRSHHRGSWVQGAQASRPDAHASLVEYVLRTHAMFYCQTRSKVVSACHAGSSTQSTQPIPKNP